MIVALVAEHLMAFACIGFVIGVLVSNVGNRRRKPPRSRGASERW